MLSVVPYQSKFAAQVSLIFHHAIEHIPETMYPIEQKQAWSFAPRSAYHWHKRMSRTQAWLVVDDSLLLNGLEKCVGFINLETHFQHRGYIDSLYVLPAYQGKRVATSLYLAMEAWAQKQGISHLYVDASKLSKSLFLAHGFTLKHKSYQEKRGQILQSFYLTKALVD